MARTPRSSIPASTGQGITRRAYQNAYRSHDDAPSVKRANKVETGSSGRNYAKTAKSSKQGDYNVSYGDTYVGMDDVKEIGELKPQKTWRDKRKQDKPLK